MIKYNAGRMGLSYIVRWKGSVFPKAFIWAVPNAALAILLHMYCRQEQTPGSYLSMTGVDKLWAGYTSVLGFLVVFRNNQAYTRFWEGATLINQIRGEWFNAVSSLFAFCNSAADHAQSVGEFQRTLICLASLLYCSALQQVCELNDDTLEIIEDKTMDPASLQFMQECNDRCEMILQWIQRLIVENEETKTIKIAPPLLTRAFQELSRGIVNLNNARKIKDIPFPFPYAQMITVMMLVHWATTPVIASQIIESPVMAAVVCFFVTFAFWCLIYIALEIDQPFGEDDNDLPLREMMQDFNSSLLNLLHPLAQKVPSHRDGSQAQVARGHSTHLLPSASNSCARITTLHRMSDSIRSNTSQEVTLEVVKPPEDPHDFPSQISLQSEEDSYTIAAGDDSATASHRGASAAPGVTGAFEAAGSGKSEVPLEHPIERVTVEVANGRDPILAAVLAQSSQSINALVPPGDVHEAGNSQIGDAPYSPRASRRSSLATVSESDASDVGIRAVQSSSAPMPMSSRCIMLRGNPALCTAFVSDSHELEAAIGVQDHTRGAESPNGTKP